MKGGIRSGLLSFFEGSESHIPICPLLYVICHGMYTPSARSTENQIESIAYMILASENGNAIGEPNLMKDCLMQTKLDKSLNNNQKAKTPNALRNRKKGSRNSFFNLLGYSMFSRRVTIKEIGYIAQTKRTRTKKRGFREMLLKEIESSGTNCGF